jgi:hypothetical protein
MASSRAPTLPRPWNQTMADIANITRAMNQGSHLENGCSRKVPLEKLPAVGVGELRMQDRDQLIPATGSRWPPPDTKLDPVDSGQKWLISRVKGRQEG